MNEHLNMLSGADSPQPLCTVESQVSYSDTLLGNLKRQQLQAKRDLDSVTAALDALEKHPEVANVLELISKAGR